MRFAIFMFLGLVLMTMNASGKPATYLVETADEAVQDTEIVHVHGPATKVNH